MYNLAQLVRIRVVGACNLDESQFRCICIELLAWLFIVYVTS